jgi:peptidoglycan/xylan/chitin deacetylase (PgdA/CDA1 family)
MRLFVTMAAVCLLGSSLPAAAAETCPGNPDAIGTSRTITVDPAALPQIGSMQYKTSLPLEDHEVVLTFDDGPLPPNTNRILDTLAENCVKVNYFLVGQMANAYPSIVRRIYNAGHVVGTHSQHHPLTFRTMAEPRVESEVNDGIASVKAALGDPNALAPFFRIPGLLRAGRVETYLASQSIAVWSADEVADDWHRGITAKDIVRLAIDRIEAKNHRGVLLLHDIHPATAAALPMLLKELKARGYRIVHAVPAGERPLWVPEPLRLLIAADGGPPHAPKAVAPAEHQRHARVLEKRAHHRKQIARGEGDTRVDSAMAKKKPKPQTASAGESAFQLWR